MQSVRHTLFLAERDETSGISRREHWEDVGIEVQEPEVWSAGSHLLEWFWDIDSLAGSNGFGGMNPVDAVRIQAWASLTGTEVSAWEGRALLEMARARQAGPEEAVEHETPASQTMNVQMFDALFK